MPIGVQHADPAALEALLHQKDEKHDCALRAAFERQLFFAEAQRDAAPYDIAV